MTSHDDGERSKFLTLPKNDAEAAAAGIRAAHMSDEDTDPVTVQVTPSLYVGEPPPALAHKTTRVRTAAEAVEVINAGGTAVLPRGEYAAAAQVLRTFGLSEEEIRSRRYLSRAVGPVD